MSLCFGGAFLKSYLVPPFLQGITAFSIIWRRGKKLSEDPGKWSLSPTSLLRHQLLPPLSLAGRSALDGNHVQQGSSPPRHKVGGNMSEKCLVGLQPPSPSCSQDPHHSSSVGQGVLQAGGQSPRISFDLESSIEQ